MKILALSGDLSQPLSQIRLVVPLERMARREGWPLRCRSFADCLRSDWLWADVVVVQRAMGRKTERLLHDLQSRGIAIVYEIDDLLTEPAPHLMSSSDLASQGDSIRHWLRSVHCISTTTTRLARRLDGFGPPVCLVPNYAPDDISQVSRQSDDAPLTALVASTDRQVVTALAAALKARQAIDSRMKVVAIGPIGESLTEQGLIVQRFPMMPRAAFLGFIGTLTNPVGLIPLDDSPFSNCKSAVKYFDYTMAGIACACSNVPPYADVVEHGRTGWLCDDDADSWQQALEQLGASAPLRSRIVEAARERVAREFSLDQAAAAWKAALLKAVQLQPRPRATALQAAWDAVLVGLEAAFMPLRDLNRRRLKRRRGARPSVPA